ncbi:very-long-chain (3R)-3-hydroxyacyl-CoA dehydratase [Contarinia nasturtii]|uniref:very-long-chain (3R)-3-hydroxyacyl-CoA dehydratase n=1 Tax=Contarinia nasturtii TaxID=265458 RepID=UPI0012D486F2|nr:very-long-chain (3R)-3-hydroxyacyl-CoA dehydratase [Contarinia nasturtii]
MVIRKKCPQVYWSQTDDEIRLIVALLLDDMLPNIKLEERFISLEAYGFGAADNGPHKYYFEINLFEAIDAESIDSCVISNVDSKLQIILKKRNPDIWWSRLTAQPQKQNWIHIHEETWISRNKMDLNDEAEYRDIRTDYPGIDDVVFKEEFGYQRADRKTIYLIMYNLYQFIAFFYIVLVLLITASRDGLSAVSKSTYKTVGAAMRTSQALQYLEFLNALVGYTKGSPLFPFLQVTGRNFVLFAVVHAEDRLQEMPVIFMLFLVWSLVELIRYPYYIIALLKKDIALLTWLRYSIWIVLYPLGVFAEGTILLRSLPLFEETKRFTIEMPNRMNFTFDMVNFMKFYMVCVLLPGLYFVMKHMTKLREKKLKKPKIHHINHKHD